MSVERNLFHSTFALEGHSEGMAAPFIEKHQPGRQEPVRQAPAEQKKRMFFFFLLAVCACRGCCIGSETPLGGIPVFCDEAAASTDFMVGYRCGGLPARPRTG